MDDSRVKSAGQLVAALVSPKTSADAERWFEFGDEWKRAAGEREGAHSRVSDVKNGVLFVEVEHTGWIQLLKFKEDSILKHLARRFPELQLRGIAYRLAGDAKRDDGPAGARVSRAEIVDDGVRPEIPEKKPDFTVDGVGDDALRSALRSLSDAFKEPS